jgi:hypothetical protein
MYYHDRSQYFDIHSLVMYSNETLRTKTDGQPGERAIDRQERGAIGIDRPTFMRRFESKSGSAVRNAELGAARRLPAVRAGQDGHCAYAPLRLFGELPSGSTGKLGQR